MIRCKTVASWTRDAMRPFRTGVSLHSHTSHSKEPIDFIPRLGAAWGLAGAVLRGYETVHERRSHRRLCYEDVWWTPPLCPREAFLVESRQITRYGLAALVSITDHDSVEAPLLLRVLSESRHMPVSTEWTIPWRGTVFHIGIHNLPPRRAREVMGELARFTVNPEERLLEGILDWIAERPEVLIVFNHPLWDEKGRGSVFHAGLAEAFLGRYRKWINAVELNGLRPWTENLRVIKLAESAGLAYISGGDRHCCEPNALLNVTSARTFSEFVGEIREDGTSCVAIMPQYREPLLLRVFSSVADFMRNSTAHGGDWTRWSDRVFFTSQDGSAKSLSSVFGGGHEPAVLRPFVACARLLDHHRLQAALRTLRHTHSLEFEV